MRRLRFIVGWLLLALWLPASLHCSLEAAGWFGMEDASHAPDACCQASHQCSDDVCATIEGWLLHAEGSVLTALMLAVLFFCCLSIVLALPRRMAPAVAAGGWEWPPDGVARWQFVRRAACWPRAPGLK